MPLQLFLKYPTYQSKFTKIQAKSSKIHLKIIFDIFSNDKQSSDSQM